MLLVTALIVVAALVGNVVPVSAQGRGPSRVSVMAMSQALFPCSKEPSLYVIIESSIK